VRGIWTPPAHRRKRHATRLLQGLMAAFPGRAPSFPAILPEDAGPGFFEALGFRHGALSQIEMRLDP
jgi:hypothetical protein